MSKTTKQVHIDLPNSAINILEDVEERLGVPVGTQLRAIVLHYIKSNKAVIKYDGGRTFLFDQMKDFDQAG